MVATTLPTFRSFRAADGYAAGFCSRRVVVARRFQRVRSRGRIIDRHVFVVCHPSTAARRGWKVVAS